MDRSVARLVGARELASIGEGDGDTMKLREFRKETVSLAVSEGEEWRYFIVGASSSGKGGCNGRSSPSGVSIHSFQSRYLSEARRSTRV